MNVADPANGGSVTTAYFAGGSYEVSGSSVKRYYSLGGQTILDTDGTLSYLLTDQLGSVVSVTDASGTPLSNQRYMPFGQLRPDVGQVTQTDRGYTGQKLLSGLNGLMDYNARLYDSYMDRFQQPDSVTPVGPQGLNRYSYVSNNPINQSDPSGHCGILNISNMAGDIMDCASDIALTVDAWKNGTRSPVVLAADISGFTRTARQIAKSVAELNADTASVFSDAPLSERFPHAVHLGIFATLTAAAIVGAGQAAAEVAGMFDGAVGEGATALDELPTEGPEGVTCSFSAETLVATKGGEKPIGGLQVGDLVLAYNKANGKEDYYPIEAVLTHSDEVLTEVILDGEHIETTPEHPFFTQEQGWTPAGDLRVGMHVRKADGSYGLVWWNWNVTHTQVMYNLTVDTAHTFYVGSGQWLVHNSCSITEGGGGSIDNLPPGARSRIESFAENNDTEVTVVGSRADGTSNPYSDWDYFLGGNSALRHMARRVLPRGLAGGELTASGLESGIDIFNANTEILDITRPFIRFTPR